MTPEEDVENAARALYARDCSEAGVPEIQWLELSEFVRRVYRDVVSD